LTSYNILCTRWRIAPSSHISFVFLVLKELFSLLPLWGFSEFLQHSLHQVVHCYPFTHTYIYIYRFFSEFSNSPFILCFSEVFWSSYNILCTRWRIATPSHIQIWNNTSTYCKRIQRNVTKCAAENCVRQKLEIFARFIYIYIYIYTYIYMHVYIHVYTSM